MRKGILAVMAASSVFALTSAFATGITLSQPENVTGSSSSTKSVSSTTCTATFGLDYTYDNVANTISGVIVSPLTSGACSGQDVKVTLTSTGGSPTTKVGYGKLGAGATTSIALDSAFDLGSLSLAAVSLGVGPAYADPTP
jgi:hypothetical protein